MAKTNRRLLERTERTGNHFQKSFAQNPDPNTQGPHAIRTGGVNIATVMVLDQTSGLSPAAKDFNTPSSNAGFTNHDQLSLNDAGGATPEAPPATEAPASTGTNWTPIFLALAILVLVVKL